MTRLRVPRYGLALIESLQFPEPDGTHLEQLSDDEWRRLLQLSDEAQLTLLLGRLNRPHLPPWVAERVDKNYRDNRLRFDRLNRELGEICGELDKRSIPFAILKGFTHWEQFIDDPVLRSQGDLDLWCQPGRVDEASVALGDLGYRFVTKSRGRHLDPMIRESTWEWTGDYFAPDLPIPVDLHYQLWDAEMERLPGPNENEVWQRLSSVVLSTGQTALQLHLADALAFVCLHLLMHLLHGDLRLQRAWELASFLEKHQDADDFWQEWQSLYSGEVRDMQLAVFLLSREWFGCRLPERVLAHAGELAPNVSLWIENYAWSPVESLFRPNKDELWLNLSFLRSTRDKLEVGARRLFPVHAIDDRTSSSANSAGGEVQKSAVPPRLRFMWRRAVHHLAVLPRTLLGALSWWWKCQQLGRDFLLFAFASSVFDFGEFVFFVLYNLYLLQRGFNEATIGQIAAALTAGTFAGAIPASAFMRRYGLRTGLQVAIAGTALAGTFRVLFVSYPAALTGAFLNGASMSFWAVSLPPVVASLSGKRNRTLAFSIIASIGIGVGAIAGLASAGLPRLFTRVDPGLTAASSERLALLCGCAVIALSLLPSRFLKLPHAAAVESGRKLYPRARFAWIFLAALFVWSLGTGGFNPLFNVYFSRHLHVGNEQIGLIFSVSQLTQVIAIVVVPMVLRFLGQTASIAALQIGTAVLLAGLAFAAQPVTAAILYISYMSFQYASEPCLLSMLMTGVRPTEQQGASALYFMVTSLASVLAASAAGSMFQHIGYQPALLICAVLSVVAAIMLYQAPPAEDRLQTATSK